MWDRSAECPMNKNVGIVEEEEKQETEKIEGAVILDSGGVFWINAVGNQSRQCEDFEIPKRTVRADSCWRKRLVVEENPVPLRNRYESLTASEEELKEHSRKVDYFLRKSVTKDIMAMGAEFGNKRGEGIKGQIVVDSGAADSVLPRYELEQAFPLLPKRENMRFVAARTTHQ